MSNRIERLTRVVVSLAFVIVLLGAVSEVRADPVVITSGFVVIGGPPAPSRGAFRTTAYSLVADNLMASGSEGDGTMHDVMSPCILPGCPVGTLVSGNAIVSLQGFGPATIAGVTFPLTTPFGVPLTFTTGQVAIPAGGSIVMAVTPFTMTGTLQLFSIPGGTPIFSATVFGSGIATLTLEQIDSGYQLTGIRYDFQNPVPEPATVLLLITGLAGVATNEWRRRKT